MATIQRSIQDNLTIAAQIIRKYNIGDKDFFFSKFRNVDKSHIETAWASALREIQSREVIKSEVSLHDEEKKITIKKSLMFDNDYDALLRYLKSDFDVKKLKLTDEKIERKLRNILANRLLDLIIQEITDRQHQQKKSTNTNKIYLLKILKAVFIIITIGGFFFAPRIINGLTPVETLTIRIYNRSSYKFRIGATCKDGWPSNATGSGACSHHGGVAEWIYMTSYRKTIEECREEARKISWLD